MELDFRAAAFSEDDFELQLMRWHLAVSQGDLPTASKFADQARKRSEPLSSIHKVRSLILEADLACLNKDYACESLLTRFMESS